MSASSTYSSTRDLGGSTCSRLAQSLFGFNPNYDPLYLVTSWTAYLSPLSLLLYRSLAFSFLLIVRILDIVFQEVGEEGDVVFQNRYFSLLNYWLLMLYFLFTLIITVKLKSWRITFNETNYETLSDWKGIQDKTFRRFCKLTNVLFEVLVGSTIGVAVIYWIVIYDPNTDSFSKGQTLVNDSVHGFNALIMNVDLLLCRTRIFPGHVSFLSLLLLFYIITAWIFYGIDQEWVVPFLGSGGWRVAFFNYVGIVLVFVALYYFGYALSRIRDRVGRKINSFGVSGFQETSPIRNRRK